MATFAGTNGYDDGEAVNGDPRWLAGGTLVQL